MPSMAWVGHMLGESPIVSALLETEALLLIRSCAVQLLGRWKEFREPSACIVRVQKALTELVAAIDAPVHEMRKGKN